MGEWTCLGLGSKRPPCQWPRGETYSKTVTLAFQQKTFQAEGTASATARGQGGA